MDRLSSLSIGTLDFETPERVIVPDVVRQAFGSLALAVNHGLEEEQLKVYAFALKDLEPTLLIRACLALEQTERFWPKPIEIRERAQAIATRDAAEAAAKRLLPMPAAEEDGPRYFCLDCRDEPNAWRVLWCAGRGVVVTPPVERVPIYPCGRTLTHPGHAYVERCGCSETNPMIAQARERARRKSA